MRIAYLCKRRYMGKDVIIDRYARLYEIPFQLARLGHEVRGFCLSYYGHETGQWTHDTGDDQGRLTWESRSLGYRNLPGLAGYPRQMLRQLRDFAPDVIIGASDIPHVVLSAWLARRLDVPYATDLYDNFEGFGQARIPGMVPALRRAVRGAALVTTTSVPLKDLVINDYGARGEVLAMPSTVDKSVFRPLERGACRRALGLPEHAQLVGTAGGLHKDKGIDTLYLAWADICAQCPDAHLVLAGPPDQHLPPPSGANIHYLGELAHAQTAELFNALDVGIIYLRDTRFGRYCFPQKAYEMIACGLPLVAARIGVMPELLCTVPDALYQSDDAGDLARAVMAQLAKPKALSVPVRDWVQIIGDMEQSLSAIVNKGE